MSNELERTKDVVAQTNDRSSNPKSILDSIRDTVRNNRVIMVMALVIGVATGCRSGCDWGKNQESVVGCSCTDTDNSGKKKDKTYKELKNDSSDL